VNRRDIALAYAWEFLGTWYSWGGDDPEGFDCSGLMVEVLKAAGKIPRGSDYTADGLRLTFPAIDAPRPGCLVFRMGSDGKAVHVELAWKIIDGQVLTIGSSGGGSSTTSKEAAMAANAFVKVRPWKSPPNITRYADPFQGDPW